MIEGLKAIADYVGGRVGIHVTENATRKWTSRADDPLPVERFAGRVIASPAQLDAWIERQRGRRRSRRARAA